MSSEYEAYKLLDFGTSPEKISFSSQQLPIDIQKFIKTNIKITATSLYQLEQFIKFGLKNIGIRINPGFGSGHNNRTNTGGKNSSFGIWYEYIPDILNIAIVNNVNINKIHIHIGSGADPKIWKLVVKTSLNIMRQFPETDILNIGGGYKIKRFEGEKESDMQVILNTFKKEVDNFNKKHNRKITLEIEPGTRLVGHSAILVSRVIDKVNTEKDGYEFLKLNTGMNDILRPVIYGAQHEIEILNNFKNKKKYVVVGHNCETGDILTSKKVIWKKLILEN